MSLYFFIFYPRPKKEDKNSIKFFVPENKKDRPKCIYTEENYENNNYYYKKICKAPKSAIAKKKKGVLHYHFEFELDDDKYIISFDNKENTYIFDVALSVGRKIINIQRPIKQDKIEYTEKIDDFIAALEKEIKNEEVKDDEKEKIFDEFYKDVLNLYSKKKGFSLMISVFLKIYEKKEICTELLNKFNEMNGNPKDNEKNMDRKSYLKEYTSQFKIILSNSEEIITKKEYDSVQFYGIILCYLNYYDSKQFSLIVRKLFKNRPEDLYEILLIYKTHLIHPIDQNFNFVNKFIKYTIDKKDFSNFLIGLSYIKDIVTFINIIDENKEKIVEKYKDNFKKYFDSDKYKKIEKYIIKLDNNLKLKKEENVDKEENENEGETIETTDKVEEGEINTYTVSCSNNEQSEENKCNESETEKTDNSILDVIKKIENIIQTSKDEKMFLIYFTNDFWKYVLYYYKEPIQDNIQICYLLRQAFISYKDLVMEQFGKKEKLIIKTDAENCFETDEFAFLLDQIIKKYILIHKELPDIDKLAYITQYNPYYKEPKYYKKVDTNIFDSFDLNNVEEEFIVNFREMKFEFIFKDKIYDYIAKITSKIRNISNFETVIKLIDIKNIGSKNVYILLSSLKKRYDEIVKKDILNNVNLDKALKVAAYLAVINYSYEEKNKKFDFIKNNIKKLPKKVIPLIFIEIIKICISDEKRKNELDEENKDNDESDKGEEEEEENKNNNTNVIKSDEGEDKEKDKKIKEEIDFKEMKEYIFGEFAKKVENADDIKNIMNLINCLEGKFLKEQKENEKKNSEKIEANIENQEGIINEFIKKLMKENLFTKEEFFSGNQNFKIALLYQLFKEEKIKKNEEEYYENIRKRLLEIRKDIEGNIKKKKLEEFLKSPENIIKERLSFIKLLLEGFDPNQEFERLKTKNDNINKDMKDLKFVKDNIIKYYKDTYKDLIKRIMNIMNDNQNKKIEQYQGGRIRELIEECNKLKETANQISKVKNFLLFEVIYEKNRGKTEDEKFVNSYEELNNFIDSLKNNPDINQLYKEHKYIFDKINEKLSNNDKKANEFINYLKENYDITNKELIDDLTILFKSKKYELDINGIIFFFEYFEKDNTEWNKKLSEDYKDLSKKDFKEIKKKLRQLKDNKIYDYENIQTYNGLFTCLYDKKEAIEFLFSKVGQNIETLKDKIEPTNRTINIQDIIDTGECIEHISQMKKIGNNFKIFDYIKARSDTVISQFENYSKIFLSVIELDRNNDFSDKTYEKVYEKIKDELMINILQDEEKILYYVKEKNKYEEIESISELINLKNKIHLKNENEVNKEEKETKNDTNDKVKEKCKTLIFFKNIITNLEIISDYMKILRTKGSSIPIYISIKVKMCNVEYYLGNSDKAIEFEEIRNYLSLLKNKFISQLDMAYKEKINLRFLYGKQFRSIMQHLESSFNLDSFLRYILNDTNNNNKIKEGYKSIKRQAQDWINQYELYNENSLESISMYITSLFKENDKTLEKHYERMKMMPKDFYKGIYLRECKDNSMEKFIIKLFWDKIAILPVAQNVLITNKETSSEEIQAFFHRAILCNYNTLFVIEINDSFSEHQQSIMNSYIDQLLTYKNKNYNKENNETIDKKKTKDYLDSCIVFIYNEDNKNITSFLKEIKKISIQDFKNDKVNKIIDTDDNQLLKELGDIKVITSDICGLGKSGEIRRLIKESKKEYFHFPLGGILSKNTIFGKLENLLDKIKNKNYKDVAIHLDLTESKEKSIINEFFFSFFITKFYTSNESIIYIPKDISIYIEIPNCFENYLDKFGILKIFTKENITFENMPKFNYPQEIITIFNRMLLINSNEAIKGFVKEHIGIQGKYSYHQINIFIKLFISQYNKFESKLKFLHGETDVTQTCIEEFAKCTQYFTNGGFAKLLTGEEKNDKKDYIDKLSEIYDNDLQKMKFPSPLIFIIKEKKIYHKFKVPEKNSTEYKNSNEYLLKIKELLNLPNEIENDTKIDGKTYKSLLSIIEEKDNNYVITNDNFKKMILLVYRIKANVPVIIMGETGCGKTALITKLSQILNNGEKTVKIINIHPGITDEILCEKMKEKEREIIMEKKQNEEVWLFFDEINTCLSLSLITEIFINRTYYGNRISDNIRLIGACNPYRKRQGNTEKCGLSFSDDNDDELVYLVQPLPQSLLYYVFSFGSIDAEDEKKYIYSIIEKLFSEQKSKLEEEKKKLIDEKSTKLLEEENKKKINEELERINKELKLHEITTEAISQCHKYLRKTFDSSVVSLREIARFKKCVEFFQNYFTKKNDFEKKNNNTKNNILRSIICSIYLCYYIRLTDDKKRNNFEAELRSILLELINKEKTEEKKGSLMESIKAKDLKDELMSRREILNNFSDFIKIEQDYLINKIELDKGIGKNTLLKENVFLLFLSVITNIPLIIIGKPGTGKSLSAQLINKSMKGKYSNKEFFKLFPKIIQTYFQGSESTHPDDVESLFEKAPKKLEYYKKKKEKLEKEYKEKNKPIPKDEIEELPISMILFDELGLCEKSESNPLKVLHSKLEYGGKEEGVSFVGISNYTLDAAKVNRALVLSVPDLDQRIDEIIKTSENIVESIAPKIKNDKIFEILSNTYFRYKEFLQIIKELVVYKQFEEFENEKAIRERQEKEKKTGEQSIQPGQLKNGEQNDALTVITKDSDKVEQNNSKVTEETYKLKKKDQRPFEEIKNDKVYKELMKKENKIKKDFHGNRDFYHLIKGTANDLGKSGDTSDNEKVIIIIKYIERNFGGIDYEIDIDFNSPPNNMEKKVDEIKSILEKYEMFNPEEPFELTSVYLFKKLYNIQCDKLLPESGLKIDEDKLNYYNLNNCINENIRDVNSRYLLLEIEQSLTTLIYQNIKLQNPFKTNIKLYDGSPFVDDNNKEYKFKIINEIQDDAKDDKLIIIENLNQIHPFLFDLYNMNYQIIDDKKFARVCLDNFNEQLTLVNNEFRIIILVDKKFINQCNLAFLNRLEKMILSFDKLLDSKLKVISKKLIDDIKLRNTIRRYRHINYSLKDLLINCGDEKIQGLIYYFSKESRKNGYESDNDEDKEDKIDEKAIKENVLDKIYKILPQDIIAILPDKNEIKNKYIEKKNIYNFKDYINANKEKNKEEDKDYKISIIYTYTSISGAVDGLDRDMSFMISEIRSENELKNQIDEIKNKFESNKLKNKDNKYICIHFEQSNSKNIKFISNFILKNYKDEIKEDKKDDKKEDKKDDGYHYIMIIHINRNFNKQNNEMIYSLPDIKPDINQIFIDNLNGNRNLKLNELLSKDIKSVLNDLKDELKLYDEFDKTLTNFLKKELNENGFDNDSTVEYINEMTNYIKDEGTLKEKIIEATYKLIDENNDDENSCNNCKDIIDKIYNNNLINKFTLDIVSCLTDYIKEEIFIKYLKNTFKILEDNNILTTLIEIKKKEYKSIDKSIVDEIIEKYLDEINYDKNYMYNCKFLFNYNVPCLYNFFKNISNYINKNITSNYSNNEKRLRKLLEDNQKKFEDFHDKEDNLLEIVYNEIKKNQFISEVIDKIQNSENDIILKDYITYYLQTYRNNCDIYFSDDIYHKIIELLLNLRFNGENRIITKKNNSINILLIKIIWLESNVNYILNTLKIIENSIIIFNNKENQLYNNVKDLKINEVNIRYITNEKRNPEVTKEVNQCYYILLASICYSITSDEIQLIDITNDVKDDIIQIEIGHYCDKLNEINKILQTLSDDLCIYLNEMYIIDELIKIIGLFKKNIDIKKINEIKNCIRESAYIIQKYPNSTDPNLIDELTKNFESLYSLITKDKKMHKKQKDYFDILKYILFKEIKKINDIDYRFNISQKILEENEIIKKSIDIFQFLLKKYLKAEDFIDNRNNILDDKKDSILELLEKKLENNYFLEETLLYLFEKNSLIYYDDILYNEEDSEEEKVNFEDEPLKILKECIEFLVDYMKDKDQFKDKKRELYKLFCLGYAKTYCYTFIKLLNENEKKCEKPEKIIKVFNGDNAVCKMLRLYIYKIFFHKFTIDFFSNEEINGKFKLKDFKDSDKYIQIKELSTLYKIDYKIKTLKDDDYENILSIFKKNEKNKFNNKINTSDFELDGFGIDNFYVASYNPILSNLPLKTQDINQNFYNKVCIPLFKDVLLKAIDIFYNPTKYKVIKKNYNLNFNNIKPLLFGYRYCLNELSNKKGIYYHLYGKEYKKYLTEKLYPGNDTQVNLVYSDIINHFKFKPEEGCYVCLCQNWYYHSIRSGFPGKGELNMACPKCMQNIGSYEEGKAIKIVKRKNYFRILKNNKELEEINNDNKKKSKLNEVNYILLKDFKETYIFNQIKDLKGIYKTDEKSFKNDNKIIRNLSQISFRILNYILYIHLFFARIITDKRDFDDYLPKNMSWVNTINECWNILKNELLKLNIDSIEEFMHFIFVELLPELNQKNAFDTFNDLIKFEDNLESIIQAAIEKFKKEVQNIVLNNKESEEEKTSPINLLEEKFTDYKPEDFPFYKYFYYVDYLNEKYIKEKMSHMDDSRYPVLKMYLEYISGSKKDKNELSLNKLNIFNNTLNLVSQNYFNNVTREYAEKTKLEDIEIYRENKELFNKFIKFFNSVEIKDIKNKEKLSSKNPLSNYFIIDSSNFGKAYKRIYEKFIQVQNDKLNDLLDIKIEKGQFDINCKNRVNIQQITEKEIFNSKLPNDDSFINILFNSSYRKILDYSSTISYKSYSEYVIDYDEIERNMTELLLRNKKLLNDNITVFIYNDEVFSNKVTDIITLCRKRYNNNIIIFDEVAIYKFCQENKNNIELYKKVMNDFIEIIKFLNNTNEEINEKTKIYEVIDKIKDSTSNYFIELFRNNDSLTVDKISKIFEYYLKVIFKYVSSHINEYQEKVDDQQKKMINNYYEKKHDITKEDLAQAIRLFITFVLLPEEDKDKKIASNHNNIMNYLKSPDLWKNELYESDKFNGNLNELKSMNIQINQIISLYEILGKDIKPDFFKNVEQKIKDEEEEKNKNKSESEDDEPRKKSKKKKRRKASSDGSSDDGDDGEDGEDRDDDDDDDDDDDKKKTKKRRKGKKKRKNSDSDGSRSD